MPQVHVRFYEHPVERTDEQIEELRLAGLLVGEPSILDKLPPRGQPGYAGTGAADAAAAAPATPAPPAVPPPGNGKTKEN